MHARSFGGRLTELSESIEEGEKVVAWAAAADSRFSVRCASERGLFQLHVSVQIHRGGLNLFVPREQGYDGAIDAPAKLNKANVRKRVWMPLLERAQVRYRDIYSLRWTFVSLARER